MIRAIVTDIEGTTSSIAFVHEVLFPYARERMAEFLRKQAEREDVTAQIDQVRQEIGQEADLEMVIRTLRQWIDEDKKATPLKALQGLIWEAGYRDGDFTGHVYADTPVCLKRWHDQGIALYVFSSGSVKAQQLLFGYSDAGDLAGLFSGYYDTRIGNKREANAYHAIAADAGINTAEILFLSDIRQELDAAQQAGMQTIQLLREGVSDPESRHRQVSNFEAITPTVV